MECTSLYSWIAEIARNDMCQIEFIWNSTRN